MIRPFKITYYYRPDEGNEGYSIKNHRNDIVGKGKEHFNFEKLLSYPITAFGYEVNSKPDINPKFDRHDVIKALDFWIEYWVYQNKCDYILEGTVNKDFELTVRELIEMREAVLKLPVDTKFTRKKIRIGPESDNKNFSYQKDFSYYVYNNGRVETNMSEYQIKKAEKEKGEIFPKQKPLFQPAKDQIVEFTENIISSGSAIDQFCYMVKTMSYKEYMKDKGTVTKGRGVMRLSGTTSEMRAALFHNDDGLRFDWMATGTGNPSTWRVSLQFDGIWRVVDNNGFSIASGFRTTEEAQSYINEHRLPSEVNTAVPEDRDMSFNLNRMAFTEEFNLDFPEPPEPDRPQENFGSTENRFSFGELDFTVSDVRLRTESEHPELPRFELRSVPVEARSITVDDTTVEDEPSNVIEFRDMIITQMNTTLGSDAITMDIDFTGQGQDISMKILPNEVLSIDDMDRRYNIRIEGDSRVLINGIECTVLDGIQITMHRH